MTPEERIRKHLEYLYPLETAQSTWKQLSKILDDFQQKQPSRIDSRPELTQQDAILITYGDQFRTPGEAPLATLNRFAKDRLIGAINGIHILPFYPYSSDDGFSVIDYRQVDPDLGSWDDIREIGAEFRLVFDAVINHISRHSDWFQGFIQGKDPYREYFINVDPNTDLSMVIRPRALPLLTEVETAWGRAHVWTTFSDDQIDLNYAEPRLLLEILDLLLFYVSQGAEIIRLDAIAYLWKKIGTGSIHLPETHQVIKLMRATLDAVAPDVILLSETNVPHEENISYFGDPILEPNRTARGDEAQMVYQFPLAPLVIHTFRTGDAGVLTSWASGLGTPYETATFFNFIASHDGIGVRPAEGILDPGDVQAMVDQTLEHGGRVSFKSNPDGSQSTYELNITLYDLLNNPQEPDLEMDVKRFLASQAIMLALRGVPGIYAHSLFGSRNCLPCLDKTGRARSINREKFKLTEVEGLLDDPNSHQAKVFDGYTKLLRIRRQYPAFHPRGAQKILELGSGVFALKRTSPDRNQTVVCITSVSQQPQRVTITTGSEDSRQVRSWRELLHDGTYTAGHDRLVIELPPYETNWLLAPSD